LSNGRPGDERVDMGRSKDVAGSQTLCNNQMTIPLDSNAYFDHGNFQEETARLLEHLYDDFQPALFDSLDFNAILG
jgi:hypothetical protein